MLHKTLDSGGLFGRPPPFKLKDIITGESGDFKIIFNVIYQARVGWMSWRGVRGWKVLFKVWSWVVVVIICRVRVCFL
jgi:hypothetical protein